MSTKRSELNYAALNAELDTVMLALQNDDTDVDAALGHYQRGLEIIKLLEKYLDEAGNKITKLQATFETGK